MSVLLAFLLSGTTVELDPAWQKMADPKSLLVSGKIQCSEPDPVQRTCRGMAWFGAAPDGSMNFRSIEAISNQHGLAIQAHGKLSWQGDAVCYNIERDTLNSARLVKLSAPHARITDPRYFVIVKEAGLDALFNRTICGHAYRHRDTGDLLSVGTIDGEFAGELMHGFAMIDAKAGYRLRAAND
jgi:hypothetical protein